MVSDGSSKPRHRPTPTPPLSHPLLPASASSSPDPAVMDPLPDPAASAATQPESPDARLIFVSHPDRTATQHRRPADNTIRTTKYNIITFIPRNLFEQFRRVAYVYFFLLACLNQIPQIAAFGSQTAFVPLGIVLVLTALKDGYEDWQRHRSDVRENNRSAAVLLPSGQFAPKKWKDIRVGDVVISSLGPPRRAIISRPSRRAIVSRPP